MELQKVNHKLTKRGGLAQAVKGFFYGLNGQIDLSASSFTDSQITQTTFQWLLGHHTFNRRSLKQLIEKGYVANPIVFGVIEDIVSSSREIKYVPYRNGKPYKSGVFEIDTDRAIFNFTTTGTCVYWHREIIGFGKQLQVIDTVNLEETFLGHGRFRYRYYEKGSWIDIPVEDLIFRKKFENPCIDTNFGLSPLQAAVMPIEAMLEMYIADTSLLKNKGSELLISNGSETPLLENEQGGFDTAMNKRIGGAKRAGSVATTTAKVEVHQLGRTIKELALWDGYKVKARDICIALNYPSVLIGDPDGGKYSNMNEARKMAYTNCIIPTSKYLFSGRELSSRVGFDVFCDTSNIECLQEDQSVRAEKSKTNTDAIINLNTQVISGNISRDIAVTILVSEWGFDEIEAASVIIDKSSQNISTSDQVNVLSSIVATKVLESMTTDERRDLVGLGHIEGGETIPQPKPSF